MVPIYYQSLVLPVLLALMSGCATRSELSHIDPTPYWIHATTGLTEVHVVSFWSYPPSWAVAPGKNTIVISPSVPTPGDQNTIKDYIRNASPPYRLNEENSLTAAANAIGQTAATDNRILWVVSAEPIVLAAGTETTAPVLRYGASFGPEGHVMLEGSVRLISANDLNKQVSDLLVLDRWPNQLRWNSTLQELPRRIYLSQQMPLKKIMESSPWKDADR